MFWCYFCRCSLYLGYECQPSTAVGNVLGGMCCPAVRCQPCATGYITDDNGCQTCLCKPCPALPDCNLSCPFGYQRDASIGCPVCACRTVCNGTMAQSPSLRPCASGSGIQCGQQETCEFDSVSNSAVCCPQQQSPGKHPSGQSNCYGCSPGLI